MKFKYMLAPMEKFTDSAFRNLIYKRGADLTFTEMARVSALIRGNLSTINRTKLIDKTPTVIQLLPLKEVELEKYLKTFEPEKNFQGFNLNIGCPSTELIKLGMGCALIKRPTKVKKLANILLDSGFNTSIKLRLGMNEFEKKQKVYLNLINKVNADYFIVHGKHGKENEQDKNDFSIYKECIETNKNIIANGNITTKNQIQNLKEQGIKGVMIGWGAIKNPNIFAELKNEKQNKKEILSLNELKQEYLKLAKIHKTRKENINNILKHTFKKTAS
ncbi:MAG: tRNA-dihydrouridine synthase family protein [Nanoarchaeota archaeon]